MQKNKNFRPRNYRKEVVFELFWTPAFYVTLQDAKDPRIREYLNRILEQIDNG